MTDRVEGLNLKLRISKRIYHFEYCASEDEEPRAKGRSSRLAYQLSTGAPSSVLQLTLQNSEDSIYNRIIFNSAMLFGKSNDGYIYERI